MRNGMLQGLELIAGHLQDDDRIKSIFSINQDELDFNKRDLYPMANIRPNSLDIDTKQITYEVVVLDQRDNSKKAIVEKFKGNDNRWDNWALATDVLNTLRNKIARLRNDWDIKFVSASSPILIDRDFANGLDGVSVLITLEYNDRTSVC
jgi:hypothetical protein